MKPDVTAAFLLQGFVFPQQHGQGVAARGWVLHLLRERVIFRGSKVISANQSPAHRHLAGADK